MEKELTPQLLEKAKQAKSPEELLALAKENGTELTEESVRAYFDQLHKTGELSDDELDNISGGGCCAGDGRLVVTIGYTCNSWRCKKCGGSRGTGKYSGVCANCRNGISNQMVATCEDCKFCSYEKGLWLCNNPENMK